MKNLGIVIVLMVFGMLLSCDGNRHADGDHAYDSLFLGIHLGMGRQEFYDHCAELNRHKVFTHGPTNTSVQFTLANELDEPVIMSFYPDFYKDKIVDMPVTFTYQGWAPWNKEYGAEMLLPKMLGIFERWYGKDFKLMEHPVQGTLYYKVDGKRRINLFIRDDQFVQAVFTDLALDKERENEKKKAAN